jgi:hypothetical protein
MTYLAGSRLLRSWSGIQFKLQKPSERFLPPESFSLSISCFQPVIAWLRIAIED